MAALSQVRAKPVVKIPQDGNRRTIKRIKWISEMQVAVMLTGIGRANYDPVPCRWDVVLSRRGGGGKA